MHLEQLRAEVAALVRQASISPQDATAALDWALTDVFSTVSREVCCPYCGAAVGLSDPLMAHAVLLACPECSENSVAASGVITSKRHNHSSVVDSERGLFLRFKDAAGRERYVPLYGCGNLELRSKDVFSVCLGLKEIAPNEGVCSVINHTLQSQAKRSSIRQLNKVLAVLQNCPSTEAARLTPEEPFDMRDF